MAMLTLFLVLFVFLQDNVECVSRCVSKYSPYYRGYYMKAVDCPGATLRNSSLTDTVCCIFDTALVPSVPQHINVSRDAYLSMVGDTVRTRTLYPFYMQALSTAEITSKQEIAAFTAQILYETSGMNFSEENSNGEKYKGVESLGNLADGGADDTRRFISRGFLPLIGRHMYGLASSSVNRKIIRQPEMVALPSIGFQIAAWLWKNGYSSADNSSLPTGNLGMYFNGSEYSFVQLSYKIQQSTTGIEKLFQHWRHTVEILGLPCPSQGSGSACVSGKRKGLCKLMTSCKGEYTTDGCPGPLPIACCLDCRNPIDLAFVLDSSGSVTLANFRLGLEFIIRVCEYFDIEYPHGTRVSLIRYSTDATIMFRFNTYINKQDIFNAIRTIPYQAGATRTDLALLKAHKVLFENLSNGVRPKELGVPRVLVLLTDGMSSSGPNSLVEPSALLRKKGVNIFVMGIGQSINKNELNIIASDPDADHVVCPKTFADVNSMVERMREASCYEPALLDEDNEVISSVQQNSIKYYKYDLKNKTGIKTAFIETTGGRGDISVSMKDKNPRNYPFNLGFCGSRAGNKLLTSGRVFTLKELESIDFCNVHKDGGCTDPRLVSNEEFLAEGIVIYVRRCSSRWFYVSIEGINETNTFNMTLFKDFIRTDHEKMQNITEAEKSENKTVTFPIPQNVYIGVAVATVGTTATVASVVTLSCAKEFQVKGSTKIKKKKRAKKTAEGPNNNAEINKGFEGDDDVKHVSCKSGSTLAPLVEKYEHMSTGGPSRNATDRDKELLQKEKVRSIYVAEMEVNNIKKSRTSSCSSENQKRKTSIHDQTVTLANANQSRSPPPRHRTSLVSSMIHDLQREDTIIQTTVKSVKKGSGERNSCVEQSRIQRQITSTSVSISIMKPPQGKSDEKTACCFLWKPSSSTNKVKKSTKTEEDPEKLDLEKNGTEVENDEKAKKVSFLKRIKRKLTWRNALVVLFPCFSYYILEKGNAKKPLDSEKEKSKKDHCEIRDRRFERDMQMSQAFCVLLSQLLFLAGVDARNNKIACAVVAIAMNYLSLVTLAWLIVQALYLFSFTRKRDSEAKQKFKTNLYYAGAWGLPLFTVVILASKYDSYNKHPHCWISFSDALSWSVATPMITLGMVQVILIILLVKALVTYRKSGNADENEDKRNVIKSGLSTVACITITVIVTWLLGSLSLNIDRDVYHTFFTIFNALQGFAFFLFYVVLNPQVRQLLVTAWEWKESSATPFDEHEAIEVEEDKEKDKKKGKGKSKAANDKKSKERKPEDLCTVNTVQNVAEARMAAASIVKNSKGKNKDNVTLVKFDEKKETGNASLASKPSGTVPARRLPPITQQKNKTPSNQSRGKTVLPNSAKAPVRKTNDLPSSPKGKRLRSPSPSGPQSHVPLQQKKKTAQFELKDNVPVAAFSSPPHRGARPKSPQRKLQPIPSGPSKSPRLKPKNQKQAGKKKLIAKGNKT